MPDVCRSDSQRSDASQRPRVSFNRDVHVKRISTVASPRVAEGGSLRLPVRRRLSRREGQAEARRALQQAGAVSCSASIDLSYGFRSLRLPNRGRKARAATSNSAGPSLSTSLTDLSAEPPERPKRRKETPGATAVRGGSKLKRSQSERSSERPRRDPISAAFHSLERKRHKTKAQDPGKENKEPVGDTGSADPTPVSPPRRRHHSEGSDRSPSPRPRKNILKKSHSDGEDVNGSGASPPPKKQLSPIIEDAPRDGYDFAADAMHSSQAPAAKPALTRGHKVETLVRRLSQETLKKKKPPRGLSPSALVTPGDDRRHNNNLPFSYTEPPTGDRFQPEAAAAASPTEGQVIYAEVVVGGGGAGKQTVHTKVAAAQRADPPPREQLSDEDEGVSLSMDYGVRTNGYYHDRNSSGGHASKSRQEYSYSGVSPDGGYKKEYVVQQSSSRYETDFGLDSSGRGRADGMDSRRKDFLIESSGRYEDRNGISEYLIESPIRKTFNDDFIRGEKFSNESRMYKDSPDSGGYFGRDSVDSGGSPLRRDPVVHTRVIDSNDLSSRRDRLESRIESQRKERFVTSRLHEATGSYNKRDLHESRLSESARKYATDPPRKATVDNRREFLASQIDYGKDTPTLRDDVRYENDRNRRKSAARYVNAVDPHPHHHHHHSTSATTTVTSSGSNSKKDFFADSGIEVDYRKEPSGTGSRRYDDVQTVEGPSAKIIIGGGSPASTSPSGNVTRVDLRTPATTPTPVPPSDAEDEPRAGRYSYSAKTAGVTNFSSTRLVQERHKSADVLPASTVLIRHYAPAEDQSREPSPKHRDRDLRDRDRDRDRDRERDRERDHDRDRESRDLRIRERDRREHRDHSGSTTTTATTTTTRTLSRTQKEQRASEKLICVERLGPGDEVSDADYDDQQRDDTDVDDRHHHHHHHHKHHQQQRRRRERDRDRDREEDDEAEDEQQRARKKKISKKVSDVRNEDDDDAHESELDDGRRADTIKRGGTLRAEDQKKKGPAPAPPPSDVKKKDKDKKKQGTSAMEKVKQLFGGSSKKDKKKKKEREVEQVERSRKGRREEDAEDYDDDPVAARYTEYKGDHMVETDEETLRATPHSTRRRMSTDAEESQTLRSEQVSSRQRLATPSPAPSPSPALLRSPHGRQVAASPTPNRDAAWFKSLDRLNKNRRTRDKSDMETTDAGVTEDEASPRHHSTPSGGKSLRFFGDTDAESVISIPPPAAPLSRRYKTNSALQVSSKTLQVPTNGVPTSAQLKQSSGRRHHRSAGDVATSSAESTTEGDSSQQSQRSVVYLHAATVGDIPGPRSQSTARRAQSREELSSVTSSQLQPQTKTISRSISVLAPWRPKHSREGLEVHYTNEDNNRNYIKNGRPPKVPSGSQQQTASSATASKAVSRRRSGGADAASKIHAKQKVAKAMSIESLSHKNGPSSGSSGGVRHTLEMRSSAKKRSAGGGLGSAASVESLSHHSNHSAARHQSRERSSASKKNSALNASAIELSTTDNGSRSYKNSSFKKDTDRAKDNGKVSRSVSMPKDTRVTAGWFKLRNKKQGT